MFVLPLVLKVTQGISQSKMGVNIFNEMSMVNVINEGVNYSNVASYDAQGWPKSNFTITFDWRLVSEWVSTVDDPEKYRIKRSGLYKCSFEGQADLSGATISNKTYNAGNNTTTFDITVPTTNNGGVFWQLNFSNTKRTLATSSNNSGITKLKILRPGYALNTAQTFNTDYINLCKSASFGCYRYYAVNNVWEGVPVYPKATTWDNRKLPTDANQANMINVNGKSEAWCWEYIIEFANILKKDIWINIHVSADDNYITSLANKLKAELDPNINIYVEVGNECWSADYQNQDRWLDAQAKALGIGLIENYARNTVRASNLFKNVYGAAAINNKIRVVLGAQQAWLGRSETQLNYIKNNHGEPKTFIYALAPSTYFNGTGSTVEEALNLCHTSIMKHYDDENDDPSLRKFLKVSTSWGLPGKCVSYEGQEHMDIGNTTNLAVEIGKHRDIRMASEQYANFQSFFDYGGSLACQFGIWAAYTRYGCWGLTDDPMNPDRNYKFKAARTLSGDVVNAMPVPLAPIAPSCLTESVVSATEKKLTWVDNSSSEDGFEIWYKETAATIWKYYGTVGANKLTTNFIYPTAGKTYQFRVRAYNFSQWSPFNLPCGTIDTQSPGSFTLSSTGKNDNSVSLSWTAATDNVGVTGYNVFMGPTKLTTTQITGTTFVVNNLTTGTTYDFTVKANDASGNLSSSNTINVTTSGLTTVNDAEMENAIAIFPNPTTGDFIINIKNDVNSLYSVNIFDVIGKKVHNTSISKNTTDMEIPLNLGNLPNGIYIIEISNSNSKYVKKLEKY